MPQRAHFPPAVQVALPPVWVCPVWVTLSCISSATAATGIPPMVVGMSTVVFPLPGFISVTVTVLPLTVYFICAAVSGMAFPPTVALSGNIRVSSDVHWKNADTPIDVTDLGIFTEVSPAHSVKTPLPIFLTPSEIFTEVSPVQLVKA